jgi:hypothetical protein
LSRVGFDLLCGLGAECAGLSAKLRFGPLPRADSALRGLSLNGRAGRLFDSLRGALEFERAGRLPKSRGLSLSRDGFLSNERFDFSPRGADFGSATGVATWLLRLRPRIGVRVAVSVFLADLLILSVVMVG